MRNTSHGSEWPSSKTLQVREGVEKQEPSYTIGGNVNWYNHYEKQYGGTSEASIFIELPYDPAILLLGIHPEKTFIQKDTCTIMFIAALLRIAMTWKKP